MVVCKIICSHSGINCFEKPKRTAFIYLVHILVGGEIVQAKISELLSLIATVDLIRILEG
jgi:hypothetical protein